MKKFLILGFCLFATSAYADIVALNTSDANGWILENYSSGGPVVIWNTGAKCVNGVQYVNLPSPTTVETNRLWSTIMSAKVSGAKIFIRYDTANCTISSFGFS